MIAKLNEQNLNQNADDVNEYSVQAMYDSPATGLELGAIYQFRKSGRGGNDIPTGSAGNIGGVAAVGSDQPLDIRLLNIYMIRERETFRFAMEASLAEGNFGVTSGDGTNVAYSGFALATETDYLPQNSRWKFHLKAGMASGDDPGTGNDYEGYLFDRNYDVATLLFNHQLGSFDVLGTSYFRGDQTQNSVDNESLANVVYAAPSVSYQWSDQWSSELRFVTGILSEEQVAAIGDDLGFEVDINLTYQPTERITWINELAFFSPGSVFEQGSSNLPTSSVLGLVTKAAISF